jgi:hypothetical protein
MVDTMSRLEEIQVQGELKRLVLGTIPYPTPLPPSNTF